MKSKVAFTFNCQRLFEDYPRVYMWTFTFREAIPVYWTANPWNRLQRALFHYFGRFEGIRVAEFHQLHGIHFHVLVSKRLPVVVVRRMAERFGFGRIHVCVADKHASLYLGKYLGKQQGREMRGVRAWACFGESISVKTRVANISVHSELSDRVKVALRRCPGASRAERFRISVTERKRYFSECS